MFFKVKTTEEVQAILEQFGPLSHESVPLDRAMGRILSRDVISPENLPGFRRSSMDGYAVKSRDTFGATESLPALLEIIGEVSMGEVPSMTLKQGEAVKISTGGMLPDGADGVVMVEYCHSPDESTLEVGRTISPQENIINADDDFKKGSVILKKDHMLRPQDLGAMAGLGITSADVYQRPKVAILSTGDEVLPIDQRPGPGQVRDINTHTLSSFCCQFGAEPIHLGLGGDDFKTLRDMVEQGIDAADTLWISGGSSVGVRDLTIKVFESFDDMDILVHGIAISPGKPTIIAKIGSRAIFGLPGHTASAMVVAEVFLAPFLRRLAGDTAMRYRTHDVVDATLNRNIESASGREDYIRVMLSARGDQIFAEPIFGKSGLISTLVEADGLLKIGRNTEGKYQGDRVKVMVFQSFAGVSF